MLVMLSGGVDSSVAAALLKERGFGVRGVHIKMWSDPDIPCNFKDDREHAMRAAAHLGISFETWDLTKEYRAAVVDYLVREYKEGRTPNPDVMCNRDIKFGVFLERALRQGVDFVASGHYVQKQKTKNPAAGGVFRGSQDRPTLPCQLFPLYIKPSVLSSNVFHGSVDLRGFAPRRAFLTREASDYPRPTAYSLYQAKDKNKDQSYFLWTLTQAQLAHCLFPLGAYTKPEVRAMARKLGLPNAEKRDSQGICFIGEIDLRAFLQQSIPVQRGAVVTTSGKEVGEHEGMAFYTIGQRHGLEIGGGIPYYVAAKDIQNNTLTVAEGPFDEQLFSQEIEATNVNWISGVEPAFPLQCEARIRYRQPLQKCAVTKQGDALRVAFHEPQRAVTEGQSVVFYANEEMLGGGVIA